MSQHSVEVSSSDFSHRLQIFSNAEDLITLHNSDVSHTWQMSHNKFSHLSALEFREMAGLGLRLPSRVQAARTGLKPTLLRSSLRGVSASPPPSTGWPPAQSLP